MDSMVIALFRSQIMREISASSTAPNTKANLYLKRALISGFILSDYLGLLGVSGGFFLIQYFSDSVVNRGKQLNCISNSNVQETE